MNLVDARGEKIVGALTIDVEEYFHVENLRPVAPPETWDALPSRVEGQVERLLDVLDRFAMKATFFTLGWVAARNPRLIERIAMCGHEVASHGFGHEMLTSLDRESFRRDLRRARALLEDAAQRPVVGYRAPTWSIGPRTEWALDVLVEEGYRYDASVFPVRHDRYGDPAAPIVPHRRVRPAGTIVELPPLVWRVGGTNLPAAGGGYLRLLPAWFVRSAVRQAVREARPAVLYLHPWEIDPGQPRFAALGRVRALRHYAGLAGFERKLAGLLEQHRYGRAIDVVSAFEATEQKIKFAAAA